MATTLTIPRISAGISWDFQDVKTWGNSQNSASFDYSFSLADGTAANQADRLYVAQGTIAASSNLDLDLAAGLTDLWGSSITFVKVKAIFVHITTDTAASAVTVGGHGTAAFINWVADASDKVKVLNGGVLLLAAPGNTGYAVTATSADILRITNLDSGVAATYKVAIVGTSA